MVPSIQYWITDLHHYAILGNVLLYLGMAVPTFFLWPLPLVHGRKVYILGGLGLAMGMVIPQGVAVSDFRSPYTAGWRGMLLAARGVMGVGLGVAGGNWMGVLMDLFGGSLMSGNPHQEVVDEGDRRREGGGMGVWLGLWTWCWMGSLGAGFAVGAGIVDRLGPREGFWVSLGVLAVVAGVNALCPEVRPRGAKMRMGEVVEGRGEVRGEVMMHRVGKAPSW